MYDYIAADLPVDGYDCSLKSFIGSYRDESCPQVLEAGQCSNSAMHSDNCVGVLSSPVPLSPGESRGSIIHSGAAERREEIAGQIADAFSSATQRTGLQTLREYLCLLQPAAGGDSAGT